FACNPCRHRWLVAVIRRWAASPPTAARSRGKAEASRCRSRRSPAAAAAAAAATLQHRPKRRRRLPGNRARGRRPASWPA
ncbi:Os10g0485800, partial [Oryza sativa Japonica Group]